MERKSKSTSNRPQLKQTTLTRFLKTPTQPKSRKRKIRKAKTQFGDWLLDEMPDRKASDSEEEEIIIPKKKQKISKD